MRIPSLSMSALAHAFREPARPNPRIAIARLLHDVETQAREPDPAFRAMVSEIEQSSTLRGPDAEQATFDVLEHLVARSETTQAALSELVNGLPAATLHHVARPGTRGGSAARAVIDNVLRETLQARTQGSQFDPDRCSDADIGDLDAALRCLHATDPDGVLELEIALRKERAAAPFRESMSRVFASTNDVAFLQHLDIAQARFQATLETWCALGERVEGGDGTADAHYRLVRDFVDRLDLAAVRGMHERLERPEILGYREAIALAGQVLLLEDPPEAEAARAMDLFHLASLGMLSLASAVADSLASRDPQVHVPPVGRNAAAPPTDAQRRVLEAALGLGFQGDKPVLLRTVA